jgi:hypothetical protein
MLSRDRSTLSRIEPSRYVTKKPSSPSDRGKPEQRTAHLACLTAGGWIARVAGFSARRRGAIFTTRPEARRFLIDDGQSVKNTDTAGQKGYDAGKKVSGIKRHIAVHTQSQPHAVTVTRAGASDRNGALAASDPCTDNLQCVASVLLKCRAGRMGRVPPLLKAGKFS